MKQGSIVRIFGCDQNHLIASADRLAQILKIVGCFAVVNVDGIGVRSCLVDFLDLVKE